MDWDFAPITSVIEKAKLQLNVSNAFIKAIWAFVLISFWYVLYCVLYSDFPELSCKLL